MSLWSEMNKMLCWLQGVQLWLVVAVKVAGPSRSAGRLTLRMYAKWAWGRMWSPHSSFFFCCAWFSSALLNLMWVQQVWTLASRWFALTMGFIFLHFLSFNIYFFRYVQIFMVPLWSINITLFITVKMSKGYSLWLWSLFFFFFCTFLYPAWCYS